MSVKKLWTFIKHQPVNERQLVHEERIQSTATDKISTVSFQNLTGLPFFRFEYVIWPFDGLFQNSRVVIPQLFCRQIAIQHFRLKLKRKRNLRHTECTLVS